MTFQPDAAGRLLTDARAAGRSTLDERTGKAVLSSFGIPVPRSILARDADEAARQAGGLTPPLAVKVVSPEILHKSDAGGVVLGLGDPSAVRTAIENMARRAGIAGIARDGWLVEEMAPDGREVVVGGYLDAQFGPMLMVGLGGILVELLGDVAFRICPIDATEARAMLDELRGRALLQGVRGRTGVDEAALVDVMVRVGGPNGLLMTLDGEVAEVDLNPVIVSASGAVAVDARVILTATGSAPRRDDPRHTRRSPLEEFRPLFEPRTIAVLGASTREVGIANTFIRRLLEFGYRGPIYPIHPSAATIEGLEAYRSLGETPAPVDYAYVAIGAKRIPDALAAANGRCRIAQVVSSGFGEVSQGKALEQQLVQAARAAGVRVIGPNCLGTYSPRGGLTFPEGAPREAGSIGVVSQSGGLSTDFIKRGQWRGLRFSGLVTVGNSADVKPHELLEYFLEDPQTRAIGIYIEDVKEGRAFSDLLRSPRASKPVVILRGGRSQQGRLAAASHTGALAGDDRAWSALAAQAPVALVSTVNGFVDTLLALQHLELRPERPTRTVTLFGNGGGSSVLGADSCAEVGLDVSPFTGAARLALEALALPPGTSVANPIDTPVRTLQEKDGWVAAEILDIIHEKARPDAIAMHLNLAAFVGRGKVDPIANLFEVIRHTRTKWPGVSHFVLALRTDGSPELDDRRRFYREQARSAGIPIFDEIPAMVRALAAIGHLERRLGHRR